ncbi:MAG: hypothetical protein K0U41_09020 [Gammaproteobacteria bacterium]|nr:hypothetical protein [Gammaproteobacteria bacterium]
MKADKRLKEAIRLAPLGNKIKEQIETYLRYCGYDPKVCGYDYEYKGGKFYKQTDRIYVNIDKETNLDNLRLNIKEAVTQVLLDNKLPILSIEMQKKVSFDDLKHTLIGIYTTTMEGR